MSKKLDEKIAEIRKNLVKKTWSFEAFVDLLTDYINEPEYESHVVELEAGEDGEKAAAIIKTYPVKKFRKTIKNILMDFGVDEEYASKVETDYKFKKKDVETMYDFMTDFIYQYLKTGRKLQLLKKEDVVLDLIMEDVKADGKAYKGNDKIKGSYVKHDAYKKVKATSKCPAWLKTSLSEDQKTVLKQMNKIYK